MASLPPFKITALPLLKKINEFDVSIEEEIALAKIRETLLFASDIEYSPFELFFYTMEDMVTLTLEYDRIVRHDGYLIFMDGLEESEFIEKDDLSFYKLNQKGLKLIADIDFSDDGTDKFNIELKGQADDKEVDFEKIIDLTYEGAKYYNVPSGGQVSIPTEDVLSLLKSFNTYDVYKNDEDKYVVKTYRAGVVSEMEKMGITLKMSRNFSKFWKEISDAGWGKLILLPKTENLWFLPR